MDELRSVTGPLQPSAPRNGDSPRTQDSGLRTQDSFDTVLREQQLKFSNHAQQRLQQRDITLGDQDVAKINQAVDRAQQKGSKESLILLDDMAFVVSVKNRVVITAVDQPSMKQNVFTNIDSVVIA